MMMDLCVLESNCHNEAKEAFDMWRAIAVGSFIEAIQDPPIELILEGRARRPINVMVLLKAGKANSLVPLQWFELQAVCCKADKKSSLGLLQKWSKARVDGPPAKMTKYVVRFWMCMVARFRSGSIFPPSNCILLAK
ncbi:hypothetical protein HHK36_010060 [Tetracentron sinense]|uniref:Uncharacterized protein n=1 Tax=Tetracentron sinense TaxID=13715 RepID=A0A834ZEA7_TETSI|nr:hypothetical protein HHK36_010060 [Tetracentron sinense]